MSNTLTAKPEFDWTSELEKTVFHLLVTTFGLDFLLFEDKRGGDVDTINNVRQCVYATNENKQKYKNREDYNSHSYHSDQRYIKKGRSDKILQKQGQLGDAYRVGKKLENRNGLRQLDHTISSKEISNDPGRVLAGLSGIDLANQDSNLNSTHWYINNLKRDHSMEKFVNEIAPLKSKELENSIKQQEQDIENMPTRTPGQRSEKEMAKAKLEEDKNKKKAIDDVLENKEKIIEADKKARAEYNKQINWEYYTSSNFLKSTAVAAGKAGLKMGMRQALGLVLAEIWFELRERIPTIYQELKQNFTIVKFLEKIAQSLKNIFERVKERFKDLLSAFKDGAISGVFGNISTTIMNIFLVSEKVVIKLIREMWNSIVSAIKLITFNPENLNAKELFKGVLKILSAGLAVLLGTILNAHLNTILVFPMGDLISAFLSTLATGVMTLAFGYFIENGLSLKKLWEIIFSYKTKYEAMAEHMQEINAELDRYLLEWANIEFNLNPNEIAIFADSLESCNSELERTLILKQEVSRRELDLPFELGNEQSGRDWLASLIAK
ncbi:ATPase [Aggregatibacter actinomycetemcomitans]|uniref:ATPase n=2 Tax=Aggregatibacter actinomycetemcomitans TaxID=714 RepID=UPI00197C1EFC|nr:ATPase [Aggregatibacter actinomycetemcomitans]MBN6061495.1 ATPase [Aggregatibacter actinomycetemcomitans]UEL52657.1 ATPase [Aggregatibacter actinomycetemcomitans]